MIFFIEAANCDNFKRFLKQFLTLEIRTGSSQTTYALLGHSSSYYSTAPPNPTPAHGQVTSMVGSAATHNSVYQSIVYPHTHQYHHGTIPHSETRASLYAQSPHHGNPSVYRLPPNGSDVRHQLQQQDEYLETIHANTGGNGGPAETVSALHGLTSSPTENSNAPVNNPSNGSASPEHDTRDMGRSQPSSDPAVWRPY